MAQPDPLSLAQEHSAHAAWLLREREARGLMWSMAARAAVMVVGIGFALFNAHSAAEAASQAAIIAAGTALMVYCGRLIRRRERHLFVGRVLVGFDLCVIAVLPFVWYQSNGGSAVNPVFLLKNDIVLIVIVFQVINALALRPLYPMLVTLGALVVLFSTTAYVLRDPRVVLTDSNLEDVLGEGLKLGLFGWRVACVVLSGFFMTRLAGWARSTIVDVVSLEDANRTIMEEQARAVFQAKMDALGDLVAGIAHEINTPLGAMAAAADTSQRSAERLLAAIEAGGDGRALRDDPKLARIGDVLSSNERVLDQARERMSELVASLKGFASLDGAEIKSVDLRESLDGVLSLIGEPLRGEVRVERHYEDVPPVVCRAQAIHQALMTIVVNAFEAMEGHGVLTVSAREADGDAAAVVLEIADTGPGMDRTQLENLFELGFAAKRGRIGIGLGLPAARTTVESHGGELTVTSEPGRGTRFRLQLPAAAASRVELGV